MITNRQRLAVAGCSAAFVLLATSCAAHNPRPSTTVVSDAATPVSAPNTRASHAALVSTVLGSDGFQRDDDGGGLDGGDVFQMHGGKEVATVTFQADLPILREHFPPLRTSPRGVQYAITETGYGAVSILVVDGQKAVILSVVPQDPDGKPALPASALLTRAERFLRQG